MEEIRTFRDVDHHDFKQRCHVSLKITDPISMAKKFEFEFNSPSKLPKLRSPFNVEDSDDSENLRTPPELVKFNNFDVDHHDFKQRCHVSLTITDPISMAKKFEFEFNSPSKLPKLRSPFNVEDSDDSENLRTPPELVKFNNFEVLQTPDAPRKKLPRTRPIPVVPAIPVLIN